MARVSNVYDLSCPICGDGALHAGDPWTEHDEHDENIVIPIICEGCGCDGGYFAPRLDLVVTTHEGTLQMAFFIGDHSKPTYQALQEEAHSDACVREVS